MKKFVLFILAAAILTPRSVGCLNGKTIILANGLPLYEDSEGTVPYGHNFMDKEPLRRALAELDSLYQVHPDANLLTEKGMVLIVLGEYQEAINILLKAEKQSPGLYATAANLGTAYELEGQNKNALKWISKAIEIDTLSHHHTEWLHVNILKAKIGGDSLINSHFLIGTDFGNGDIPTSTLDELDLETLANTLYYQLNERISFIKSKDPIVAKLLFDLGDVHFLTGEFGAAKICFQMAEEYGFDSNQAQNRISHCMKPKKKPADSDKKDPSAPSPGGNWILFACIGVLAIAVLGWIISRKKS